MAKPNIESLAARLDVQAIVLQELARVLKPTQAAAVASAVELGVANVVTCHRTQHECRHHSIGAAWLVDTDDTEH